MSTDHHFNFSPSDILPSTFSHLLSLYPKTAQTVFETKLRAKSKKATEQDIKSQVNAFVELDNWRYETLPTTLIERWGVDAKGLRTAKRAKAAQDVSTQTSSGRMYLEKDELVRLMEWKL